MSFLGGNILEITWSHPTLGSGVFSAHPEKISVGGHKRYPRKNKKYLKKIGRWKYIKNTLKH